MNIELLQQLCEASAVSGDEQEVRDILINTLEPCVNGKAKATAAVI
ncbi:fructose-specific phosphotransferase system protein FrvX [Shigella sonnei]|nr:fructose-specific phosphotransferase system protein FrvX [Shigella sonnei]SRJ58683.1 fructose-specific phosphotransferase system protein FrvX [Shigella sonnei]SRR42288.1 fructose-specific phosphotransferase system protein FrvX [Shigella sonnei]SRT85504.1 fructose-specific phosphotransferase system protein FrvX [Shigella sonnei]SRU07363.1 fructose-specific phosphotransferase system protein FrvX [Shigella sonnei]